MQQTELTEFDKMRLARAADKRERRAQKWARQPIVNPLEMAAATATIRDYFNLIVPNAAPCASPFTAVEPENQEKWLMLTNALGSYLQEQYSGIKCGEAFRPFGKKQGISQYRADRCLVASVRITGDDAAALESAQEFLQRLRAMCMKYHIAIEPLKDHGDTVFLLRGSSNTAPLNLERVLDKLAEQSIPDNVNTAIDTMQKHYRHIGSFR